MENLIVVFTFVGALIALVYAAITAKRVLRAEEGTEQMKKISRSIRSGAGAYLRRQYTVVGIFFAVMFVVLCAMAAFLENFSWFTPFAFITGGLFSALSGFIGMKIATLANDRTACAAQASLATYLAFARTIATYLPFGSNDYSQSEFSKFLILNYPRGIARV